MKILPPNKNTNQSFYRLISSTEEVGISAFGAQIKYVRLIEEDNTFTTITLPTSEHQGGDYSGRTILAGGRIPQGKLTIGGNVYTLTQNDGPNTLHGGGNSISDILWQVEKTWQSPHEVGITLTTFVQDGENGFPGNRHISIDYILNNQRELLIQYHAKTDRPTFINLTNHVYWNLSGDFTKSCCVHTLQTPAQQVLLNDAAHLPYKTTSVLSTPFDFTSPRTISSALQVEDPYRQIENAKGYNNAFLLAEQPPFAVQLSHSASKRQLTMETSYPSFVFYSGGYLPVEGSALAFEAQFPPGNCNPILLPEAPYNHFIRFRFASF